MKCSKFKRIICVLVIVIMSFVLVVSPILANTSGSDLRVQIPDDVDNPWMWATDFARTFFQEGELRQIVPVMYRKHPPENWLEDWDWDENPMGWDWTQWQWLVGFFTVTQDGYLYAWGENDDGQLGDGTRINRQTPVRIMDSVRTVFHQNYRTTAIRTDGTLWAWGDVPGETEVSAHDPTVPRMIFESVFYSGPFWVLQLDGNLWTWGDNAHGQVGDGTNIARSESTPYNVLSDIVSVAGCVCGVIRALSADGKVWTWGHNSMGSIGDGTTHIGHNRPFMALDDVVSFTSFPHSVMALRSDGSLWTWGSHHFFDDDGDSAGEPFRSDYPVMIVRNFVEPERPAFVEGAPPPRPTFTADDGTVFQWLGWAPRITAYYIHTPLQDIFVPESVYLADITDIASAELGISNTITALTPEQRESPDALNLVTLFIENAHRRGTSQNMPSNNMLDISMFAVGESVVQEIGRSTDDLLQRENVNLMRELRNNINFISENTRQMQIILPNGESDDISGTAFDNVSIESDFAMVTLNRDHIASSGEVEIRRVAVGEISNRIGDGHFGDEFTAVFDNGFDTVTIDASMSVSEFIRNLWPAGIALLLIGAIWYVLRTKNHRLRNWVVPTFAVIAIGVNAAVLLLQPTSEEFYTNTVQINITEGMRATVSLPADGLSNPESIMLFDENGQLQFSKYNPVTGNIDATVTSGGIFTLREHTISFADIEDRSQLMQTAVVQLASRGILRSAEENYFYPDEYINRTDFVSAIIMAFDMLDLEAQPNFVDVNPGSWYFHAIATAENERLVRGFPDGTFRGSLDIPKDQLVVIAASTLMEQMGYFIPNDIEYVLAQFVDRDMLADWSEEGIALATDANVVLHRTDARFAPQSNMTRGDAAIVLYRVFGRIW